MISAGTRCLLLRLGGECFALSLDAVREVFALSAVATPVPGAPDWLSGVLHHHGRVIPLVRLERLLRVEGAGEPTQAVLVDHEGDPLALAVDAIEGLEDIRPDARLGEAGSSRAWHRGALVHLLDPADLAARLRQRLAERTPSLERRPQPEPTAIPAPLDGSKPT